MWQTDSFINTYSDAGMVYGWRISRMCSGHYIFIGQCIDNLVGIIWIGGETYEIGRFIVFFKSGNDRPIEKTNVLFARIATFAVKLAAFAIAAFAIILALIF